jgi:S1-C subfamily serine protease
MRLLKPCARTNRLQALLLFWLTVAIGLGLTLGVVSFIPPATRAGETPGRAVFLIYAKTYSGALVSGTCFYLTRPSGRWVITANHVINDAEPGSIAARVGSASISLRLAAHDAGSDLAALIPSGPILANSLALRATSVEKGELVSIIGFPIPDVLGVSSPTIVRGTVSSDSETIGGIPGFTVAVPTTGGDSGGPVLDSAGRLVGVVIYGRRDNLVAYAVHGFHILKLLGEVRP